MINIFTAVANQTDVDSFIGELTIGIGIALMIATAISLIIYTVFLGYKKTNMVINPKSPFYTKLGILGVYIVSVLCALGKIIVFGA